jgi:hypothetical protein
VTVPLLRGLDPTDPERWERERATGRGRWVLRYGVVALGVPAAVLLDLLDVVRRGELETYVTLDHAVRLELMLLALAPTLGALGGRLLWALAERRHRGLELKRAFLSAPVGPSD